MSDSAWRKRLPPGKVIQNRSLCAKPLLFHHSTDVPEQPCVLRLGITFAVATFYRGGTYSMHRQDCCLSDCICEARTLLKSWWDYPLQEWSRLSPLQFLHNNLLISGAGKDARSSQCGNLQLSQIFSSPQMPLLVFKGRISAGKVSFVTKTYRITHFSSSQLGLHLY